MGLFRREKRAETTETTVENSTDEALLKALLDKTIISREDAMQIPTISSAISLIGQIIAATPIKLYRKTENGIEEVKNDYRLRLLNDETGDTLSSNDFWKAIVEDYYLGKGAYIYINKVGTKIQSLNYVEERYVSINKNFDPIFKDYDILVNGVTYNPWQFVKILRNSKDGAYGTSIIDENAMALSVAYNILEFEESIVKKGGNKRGFLKSAKTLTKEAMDSLKEAFRRLYSGTDENVVVLNNGIEFQEASNTMVEMQLSDMQNNISDELGKILHVSPQLLNSTTAGSKPEDEISRFAKLAVVPVLEDITCAINRDLLLESEKESMYFAADTKEILKGNIKERFEAYLSAIQGNIMTVDEVRYKEDLPQLGLDFIKLGLADVMYNPKTKEVYTPNTGQRVNIENQQNVQVEEGGENIED